MAKRFYGTACQTKKGYLPYLYCNKDRPRADEWVLLTGNRASISSSKDPVIEGAWLIGHSKLETPFQTVLAPGCQLLVDPLAVLVVGDRTSDPTPYKRIGAWREGSTAYLLILPSKEMVGMHLYVQLLIISPNDNTAGVVISHGYDLLIGGNNGQDTRATESITGEDS